MKCYRIDVRIRYDTQISIAIERLVEVGWSSAMESMESQNIVHKR